jgi:hypothetical protein
MEKTVSSIKNLVAEHHQWSALLEAVKADTSIREEMETEQADEL